MTEERITLKEVIEAIGDEVGEKYAWFLIGFEAHWAADDNALIIENMRKKINSKYLGYHRIYWDFLKKIPASLSAVVVFDLVGCISEEDFIENRNKLDNKKNDWTGFVCDFEFYIYDGEIWEINGTDKSLVYRMKKIFSPLPIFLM